MKTAVIGSESLGRERRIKSVTCYEGSLKDLTEKGCSGCLKGGKRCLSTATFCSHLTALDELSVVKNAVVVDHGPIGCSSGMMRWTLNYRMESLVTGEPFGDLNVLSTNLSESDTVFGAINKLYDTVREAYRRHNPEVIYITSTCMSSTIGEDFESAVDVLREEIPVPIVFVGCAGAKSKIWASGFDSEQHANFKNLIKPPKEKRNTVNIIEFLHHHKQYTIDLLDRIGLKPLFFNAHATVEDFAHASESIASTGVCNVKASYLGSALEKEYGVKYLADDYGMGIAGFERWYLKLAELTGSEDIAREYIASEHEKYDPILEDYRQKFKGVKAMIIMGSGYAFELVRVLSEIGIDVVHTNSFHYDPVLDRDDDKDYMKRVTQDIEDLPVSISDAQHFETIKRIEKYKPDVIITRVHGAQTIALKTGTPVVNVLAAFGFPGTVDLAEYIYEELQNKNFVKKFGEHCGFSFTEKFKNENDKSFIV